VKAARKRFAVIIRFRKSEKKKLTSATAGSKNVAFLTKNIRYTGGKRYWRCGVFAQKMLKSCDECCLVILAECTDLFWALCL